MTKKFKFKTPLNQAFHTSLKCMDGKEIKLHHLTGGVAIISPIDSEYPRWEVKEKWLEPIEDAPVSFDDWDNEYSLVYKLYGPKLDREIKDRHGVGETLRNIIYRNRKAAWDACEANDRKRTQPVIDAARKSMKDSTVSKNIYTLMKEALKTLEENET